MTKAKIYTRFSPRKNASECDSCEKQEDICRLYCGKQAYEVASVFSDPNCSGDSADRKGLWDAIESLRRGEVLVVRWRNRLARDVYLGEVIKRAVAKAGATIEAAEEGNGDSPQDKLVRGVLAEFAQYEKTITALRTKHAMIRYQASGRIMSKRLPYGYMPDPKAQGLMIENPVEQETIGIIVDLAKLDYGYRVIGRKLDSMGRTPRNAEKWSHKTIAKVIQRAT